MNHRVPGSLGPADTRTRGAFERALASGRPVVTCEISTGDGADPEAVRRRGRLVRDHVDAVNVPDNTAGMPHMSGVAAAAILAQDGIEPILHLTCRDRNRLALQSDLLGAAALGVRNVLCLTGDHMVHGDHPDAKPVFDIDSMQLVRLARRLTDEGRYMSGRELKSRPDLFVGAVENPFAPPYDFRPTRLLKKQEAGAQFIQTQIVFNVDRFATFMTRVRDLGIDRRLPILAGVAPLRSARAARHMRDKVPGMEVPEDLVRRMDQAGDDRTRCEEEGIRICVEIIGRLRAIPGIAGFHIMPIHWEAAVGEIVRRAGLVPARTAQHSDVETERLIPATATPSSASKEHRS